jgi:hypothetical protein
MTTLNVQFTDVTQKFICSYFASSQDPSAHSNLGTVDSSDARWKAFWDGQGAYVQQWLPAPAS